MGEDDLGVTVRSKDKRVIIDINCRVDPAYLHDLSEEGYQEEEEESEDNDGKDTIVVAGDELLNLLVKVRQQLMYGDYRTLFAVWEKYGYVDEEDYWCKQYGAVKIPRGWVFLSAGDVFVTRQVKAMGPHWLEVKAAKGYTRKLGIWAPEKNIEACIKLAKETVSQREAKRIVSRKQREKQEIKYTEQFTEAVYRYLDFAPRYEKLSHQIAKGAAKRATIVGSERVGRTKKLTLEDKEALAARAYIRHNYTKYEDKLINPELILDPRGYLYHGLRSEAEDEVDEFLEKHRARE